jgi:putative addiction module component (TIGR02574 family)
MSKQDILDELPKLPADERRQILERLCEMQDQDVVQGIGITAEEKAMLDQELEEYRRNPGAGSSWEDVERKLLNRGR